MRSLDPDFNYGEFALIPGLAGRSGPALDRLKVGHEMTTSRTTKAASKKVAIATVPRRRAEVLQQPLQDPVDLEEMLAQRARAFDGHLMDERLGPASCHRSQANPPTCVFAGYLMAGPPETSC